MMHRLYERYRRRYTVVWKEKEYMLDIAKVIAEELGIRKNQVEAVMKLLEEGNTIPFIARYRKEAHGGLNDEILRNLDERLTYLQNLEEKKATVLSTIEEQGALTPELRRQIEGVMTQVALEDLYRPYRPKRRTRAMIAKERGLEPLANVIWLQQTKTPLMDEAAAYVDVEKEVPDTETALQGAKDILAERIADEAEYRRYIREITFREGMLTSEAKDEEANKSGNSNDEE